MSVIRTITPGVPNSLSPNLGRTSGRRGGKNRGGVQWYQQIVDYFLDKRQAHVNFWDIVEEEYYQRPWNSTLTDRMQLEEVKPGRVYSLVHTIESMVFNRRPKLGLAGWHGRITKDYVPVLEQMLNAEWYLDYQLVRETRLCARDCAKTGWGIMLTSYDAEFDPEVMTREAMKRKQLDFDNPMFGDAEAQMLASVPDLPEPAESHETSEADSRVLRDRINSRRVSPRLFMIDPDATCLEDARWVGRMIYADIESVKADPLLKNTGSIRATDQPSAGWRERRSKKDVRNPYEFVCLYEIFERIPGGGWRMVVLAKDHDQFLRVLENPFWVGCPYRLLRWNETGEDIFAQSDILPAWPLILSERILATKVLDGYAREHMDTTFYDSGVGISEEQLNAAGSPEVGKFVKVTLSGNRPIRDLVFKLQKDPKSPEAMNLLALIERELQVATGLGPNQYGQALKSATSATEAATIDSFSRARGTHKFGAMEEFVAGVASHRLGFMAQFYDFDRVRKVAGDQAAEMWSAAKWTPADVRSGLRVRVDQGSMKPEDDATRAQQMVQALQVVAQVPGWIQRVNQEEFLKRLWRAMGFQESDGLLYDAEQMALMAQLTEAMMAQQGQPQNGQGGSPEAPSAMPSTDGEAMQSMLGRVMGGRVA